MSLCGIETKFTVDIHCGQPKVIFFIFKFPGQYAHPYLDMNIVEAPEVDKDNCICPKVAKHFGQHPQGPANSGWPSSLQVATMICQRKQREKNRLNLES